MTSSLTTTSVVTDGVPGTSDTNIGWVGTPYITGCITEGGRKENIPLLHTTRRCSLLDRSMRWQQEVASPTNG